MKFAALVAGLVVGGAVQPCQCFLPQHFSFQSTPGTRWSKPRILLGATANDHDYDTDAVAALPRRQWLQKVAVAATTTTTASLVLGPPHYEAFAERTLTTVTESYRRYVPRMETGFAYLGQEVPGIIESGEGYDALIAEIVAERGTKISALKGTMRIFASAFSDSVVTQTTRELQLAAERMTQELAKLATALQSKDKNAALESCQEAIYFAEIYAQSVNALIPRSLDPIRGPSGNAKKRLNAFDEGPYNGAF